MHVWPDPYSKTDFWEHLFLFQLFLVYYKIASSWNLLFRLPPNTRNTNISNHFPYACYVTYMLSYSIHMLNTTYSWNYPFVLKLCGQVTLMKKFATKYRNRYISPTIPFNQKQIICFHYLKVNLNLWPLNVFTAFNINALCYSSDRTIKFRYFDMLMGIKFIFSLKNGSYLTQTTTVVICKHFNHIINYTWQQQQQMTMAKHLIPFYSLFRET